MVLPENVRKGANMDNQLARIYELRLRLFHMGCYEHQVDAMLRELIGTSSPEDVNEVERQKAIDGLENYIKFSNQGRFRRKSGNNK